MRASFINFVLFILTALVVSGCNGGGEAGFGALEDPTGTSDIPCEISSTSPELNSTVVSAAAGTKTVFNISPSTSSCNVNFLVNGTKINTASSNFVEIDSSILNSGSNLIRVEATNSMGTDFHEWSVYKNAPPTCSRAVPVAAVTNMINSGTQSYTVNATKEEGETLEFKWLLDDSIQSTLVSTITAGTASQALFSPTVALNGIRDISVEVSDGLDTVTCSWKTNVSDDCSVLEKIPNVPSQRMAAVGASSTYSVTTSTASCLVNWTLNGSELVGNGTSQNIISVDLNQGSNLLKAEVTSTSGVTSKTWSVIKNTPPTCTQSPGATGAKTSVGTGLPLQASIIDVNNDTVTWGWSFNGIAVSGPPVEIANTSNSSTATFTPTDSHVGFNTFLLALNDGYDTASCNWSVQVSPNCNLSSPLPSQTTITVPSMATNINPFSIVPSNSSCSVSWSLNGISLGVGTPSLNLLSSFLATTNTVTATVSNGTSNASHTWNILKNSPPICSSLSPSNPNIVFGVGSSQTFTANITDSNDSHVLTYDWKLDGLSPNPLNFSSSSSTRSTSGTWTSTYNQMGSHNLTVAVTDSYDTVVCAWTPEILRTCTATAATPSGTTLRVANLATTQTSFGAVANDPSCAITWKLNGSTVLSSENFYTALSSNLSTSNTVEAVMANAVSSTTRSWTVTKNTPATCGTKVPAIASGNTVDVNETMYFSVAPTDANSDALSYDWKFNGNISNLFVLGVPALSANFTPALGQVGDGHQVTVNVSDSYDITPCNWTLDVIDPDSATILGVTPSNEDPIIVTSGGSRQLTISASGTGVSYAWKINDQNVSGNNTSAITVNASSLAVKTITDPPETVTATVSDIYGNSDTHVFNMRRNAAPAISTYSPNVSGVNTYRVGLNQSLAFSVTGTDPNNDALSYAWQLDNGTSSTITSSGNSASFSPNGSASLIGNHTVKVIISDGYETTTRSWPIAVNYLSDECNDLYNSSPTGPMGGKVCTLVGNPSMGNSQNIFDDQTLLKARPTNVIEIEPGVYAVAENLNHTVFIYNSNLSGDFIGLGKTVKPGTIEVVLGTGAVGKNLDGNNPFSSGDYAFQTITAPVEADIPLFKLNEPRGLAWDSIDEILYIADRNNNRVLGVNSSGRVSRILGSPSAGNSTVFNMDGQNGNSQFCSTPIGLTISQDYLYVACYGQNAIKRVNINSSSAGYLKSNIIVGRLTTGVTLTTSYNFQGYGPSNGNSSNYSWALPDGIPGPLSTATAYTNSPYELATDGNGVVYWTEFLQNYHGGKIRAYNPNAVDYTLVASGNSELTSPAAIAFRAAPLQTTPNINFLTPHFPASPSGAAQWSQALSVTDGTLAGGSFLLGFHPQMRTNGCHSISISMRNSAGTAISSASNVTVTASSSLAGGFFTEPTCTTGLVSNQFIFNGGTGQFNRVIYFKPTVAGSHVLTVSGGGVTTITNAGGYTVSPTAGASVTAASRIRVLAPRRFGFSECVPVEFQLTDSSDAPALPSAIIRFGIDTNTLGNYYSTSTCTGSQVYDLTFSTSEHTKHLYFKREIIMPAGMVSTVAGYDYSFPASYSDYANNVKIGELRFNGSANGQNGTTGLDLVINPATGLPNAIAYSSIQSSVHYLNFSNTTFSVGSSPYTRIISPRRSEILVGGANNLTTPTAISAGYNGEDQDSWGTIINQGLGLIVTEDNQKIVFADYNNLRLRTSEIDFDGSNYTSNQIRTLAGTGRYRYRQNVTSIQAPNVSLYNPYKVEFSNGYLYFSEVSNHWIRRVNVTTGIVENVAGNGYSVSYTEGQDASAEGMANPRGFKVVAYPNSASPTNYVLIYSQNGGNKCLVRAVNVSGPTIPSFFGAGTLGIGKVKTIAGDPAKNCGAWSTAPSNTDGMLATSARLNYPEDIAYINGDLFIILNSDNCIVKVDSSGILTRPQGTSSCGGVPATTTDAIMTSMTTRYPRSFYPDMGKPGNYFFVDNYDGTPGYVRYINTITSNVAFKGNDNFVSARSTTTSPFVVKTIYTHTSPSGNAYVGGVTSWSNSTTTVGTDDRVCWSAGRIDDSTLGDHAIFCAKRGSSDDPTRVSGPSSDSMMRGSASLGREQEKIDRQNATFFTPYGIAFDEEGNLYVSEYNNHVIRMIRKWW